MKTAHLIICLLLFVSTLATRASEDSKYPIHRHESDYGFTNVWFITKSRLETLPVWKDEKEEPPLSIGKAIALAKAWAVSKGASTNAFVETIVFRSMSPGAPNSKFRSVYFYNIRFGEVVQFGSHMTCIILLDGSIVEPESIGRPHTGRIVDYLD
jgi:hypothetical protein